MAEEEKSPAPTPASSSGGQKNTGMAVLCYLGILVLIPLLTEAKKEEFVKFHIKQGIVLLIADVVAWVAWVILAFIPVIGWILGFLIWVALLVLLIMGIINAASGKETELPVIGKFGSSFKI